jgi:hypothetical protein
VKTARDTRQPWAVDAEKLMVERDMTKKQLAAEIRENYIQVIQVVGGTIYGNAADRIKSKILDYFGLVQ